MDTNTISIGSMFDCELLAGYKRTSIGIIPTDWEIRTIREIGQITTGPFGTLLKAHEYSGSEGTPLISVGEVGYGTLRIHPHTPRVPLQVTKRLPQYLLRSGDIVFGRKGAVDRSGQVTDAQAGWFLGSDGIRLRPGSDSFPPYIGYQFQSERVKSWLLQNAIGTTMASLNQEILGRVVIPLPPLAEQRAIAAALSDIDASIAAFDALIAKKRDIKQATMQQLLTGKTRLMGFSGRWETRSLGESITLLSGQHILAEHYNTQGIGIPYLTGPSDFPDGVIQHTKYTDRPSTLCARGDILVTVKGSGTGTIALSDSTYCISRQLMAIRVHNWNEMFIYYALVQNDSKLQAASTGLIPGLSRSDINGILLQLPSVSEQTAIADVLSDMDAEIAALEARRDKTRAIKHGMMQELLTGRTRLPIAETTP